MSLLFETLHLERLSLGRWLRLEAVAPTVQAPWLLILFPPTPGSASASAGSFSSFQLAALAHTVEEV